MLVIPDAQAFEEAVAQYQDFLVQNGYPRDLTWIEPDDVLLSGKRSFYVRMPIGTKQMDAARDLFEQGTTTGMGVLFHTVCATNRTTFGGAWMPRSRDEAQRALMPKGLKLSADTERTPAVEVRNLLLWMLLKLRFASRQKLKSWVFHRA